MSRIARFRGATPIRRAATALAAFAVIALLGGCSDGPTSANPVAGTWTATVFQVVPQGSTSPLDLKAGGATLSITIAEDNSTSGLVFIPKALTGEATDFSESMAGTATLTGSSVRFSQSSDTFVRDLTWTVSGNTLSTDQTLTGDRYIITMGR